MSLEPDERHDVVEWDAETVRRFQDYLAQIEARRRRDEATPEIGDFVETPDGREWRITRILHNEQLDLQDKAGEVLAVPAEFARVVRKA
jgi:hypothetical protein